MHTTLLRRESSVGYGSTMTGHMHGMADAGPAPSAPLLQVLWRRRWAVIASVVGCMIAGGLYLMFARPIYSATALVRIDENGPRVYSDATGYVAESETFLQTQADVVQSTAVLARALDASQYQSLSTFAKVNGDPVAWLRDGGAL